MNEEGLGSWGNWQPLLSDENTERPEEGEGNSWAPLSLS